MITVEGGGLARNLFFIASNSKRMPVDLKRSAKSQITKTFLKNCEKPGKKVGKRKFIKTNK